ncbi:MAG: aspartate carbamoyltransferase catalytic subunit [Rhodobacterales bacterium]|nr:MAG: aspartate carbamoyltransferase catalytic subunit [Rhodobacterales bacterium]
MTGGDGWGHIPDEGQRILWQGVPDRAMTRADLSGSTMIMGSGFALFVLVWMGGAAQAGGEFWMFGLFHLFAGLSLAFGKPITRAWTWSRTFDTLTDQRAFIAVAPMFGVRSLKSYPITETTVLDYDGNTPGTIHFAKPLARRRKSNDPGAIGFKYIHNSAKVYRLLRDIQQGKMDTDPRKDQLQKGKTT